MSASKLEWKNIVIEMFAKAVDAIMAVETGSSK
jgi:hypothetical protein